MGRPRKTKRRVGSNNKRANKSARLHRQAVTRERQFTEALELSRFTEKPGWVPVKLWAAIYDPTIPAYMKVPGWTLGLELQTLQNLLDLADVLTGAIDAWSRGRWNSTKGRFECEHCGKEL